MELTYTAPNGGWKAEDDGYWHYEGVLPAGETTPKLNISYKFPKGRINRKNSISWLSRNAHRFFTMKMESHIQTGIM